MSINKSVELSDEDEDVLVPSSISSSFRPERTSNVVGQPKGQGQSTDTVLDRRKKEANKTRVGNHNRRSMADRKRNKGMIPS